MSKPPFYHTDTGSTKSSAVYQSVPTLSSPALQAPHAMPQPIDESRLPSRKTKLIFRVLLMTTALTLCLVGPILVWVWYILINNHTTIDWGKLVVYSTAGPTRFLLISTVSMTVSKYLAGPLMAICAYAGAADWLRSSAQGTRSRQPSPLHLASILNLFQGASLSSLARVSLSGMKRRELAWPPILKKALVLLVWLLLLINSLTAINLWLHVDAKAIPDAPVPRAFIPSSRDQERILFGRKLNQTQCDMAPALGPGRMRGCGLVGDEDSFHRVHNTKTTLVLTNNSAVSRVAWLDDNIAILVAPTQPSFGYRARSLGARADCHSVTSQCVKCGTTKPDTATQCDGFMDPIIACPASVGLNVTRNQLLEYTGPSGPISKASGNRVYEKFKNPISYGDVISSDAYYNESINKGRYMDPSFFFGSTGFLKSGGGPAVNVMSCDIAIYDVDYEFSPPVTYTSTSSKLSDDITADFVATEMISWFQKAGRGFENIDGQGQVGQPAYPEVYARQLSKIVMATSNQIIIPSAAETLLEGRSAGTQVTLVGMGVLAITLVLLIFTTVVIGVQAAVVIIRTDSKFLAAARGRLISVYPLIGDSFGGLKSDRDTHKPAVSAALDQGAFVRESEADRLELVQEPVDGGPADGKTVRLRPRRAGREDEGRV